jgi:hypothetical protein
MTSRISPQQREFIEKQRMFFVATAPLSAEGHVNLSPKGMDCFRVLSPTRVAYLDIIGSGNETSAHALENGRITFMFCAFEGEPLILRLYGKASTILPGGAEWDELIPLFKPLPAARQIIVAEIYGVKSSCGFGVPLMDYVGERDHVEKWVAKKGAEGLAQFQREYSLQSVDGLATPLGKRMGNS